LRVCISSDEARPTEIHIQVNGHDVNVVPPPWNRELTKPTEADLRWLDQEVLAPIGAAVARWMMRAARDEGLGYMPIGGGVDVSDAQLMARPTDPGARSATPLRSEVDEAALDEVRRAHFLYGLEEIQAVTERRIEAG
jgi:uncharacterized protein (DUF111 family)